jgi:hypothetical protein
MTPRARRRRGRGSARAGTALRRGPHERLFAMRIR